MKKRTGCLLWLLMVVVQSVCGQAIGTWKSYLAYTNTTECAEANNLVYAIADGSMFSYNKTDQEIVYYSKENGLSDNEISHIGFNESINTLLITYANGNLDLLNEQGIYNIPFLKSSVSIQDKTINSIYFHNEFAYLSTEFGIMVVNMKKREIKDTYKFDKAVLHVGIVGNKIYAATSGGLFTADTSSNLLDHNNWQKVVLDASQLNEKEIKKLAYFSGVLCFIVPGNGVFYLNSSGATVRLLADNTLKDMVHQNGLLIPYSATSLTIYTSLTDKEKVNAGIVNHVSSLKDNTVLWIAAADEGLKAIKKSNTGSYESIVSGITSNSIKRNLTAYMTFSNSKLLVTGGERWADRGFKPGTLMVYDGINWYNFDENKIAQQSGIKFSDITSVVVDPKDPAHYYASSWGEGVFEFRNNEFVNLYSLGNSSLESALPGSSERNYVRVDGLCYDSKGNLWMTNSGVKDGINVLKADGSWSKLYYEVLNNKSLIDKILITKKGYKWVNIPRETPGIFIFDDKGTLDDVSDDVSNFYNLFTDSNGKTIEVSSYYCMTEDKNGTIWMGTDKGPVICPVPDRAIENPGNLYCSNIIRPLEDGSSNGYRLLENERINAIAVDGGNRKWIGTQSSGILLVSEDGMETIAHFTTDNSPILSNNIKCLAINSATGEVFIGTDKGLVSYMGDAVEGKDDYSEIRAFPNPVRPESDDRVTITGLMERSNVKITDLNGHIIYQGTSVGGQLTWNCRNRKGERVASGIYLVLAATPDAGESVVTKIMNIK